MLIEWGERFPELWPAGHTEIRIERQPGTDQRIFEIRPAKAS